MYALVFNGAVVQIEAATFPVHSALTWVTIPTGTTVEVGYIYAAGVFTVPPAPPTPTLAQQAAAAISAGLAITSTSTSSLDGLYSVDATAQQHVMAEITSIMLNGTFADGASTVEWLDASGTTHTFTVGQFKTFATAISAYVAALTKCMLGRLAALPAATATIA